ncbi:hypothetical protein Osc7112_2916 [Oscillatoria nigro-viridis PCC 7112]|uniref:Uncharacterized protein n=1 Tax=Phormidium nigroviride PCC 7112 TaxID=179408 RepID=K9VH82_9CYAN|nr:hypothetical protein Osc7112_2916 [Oscillatoria nigro-viridis PCC 7112]
MKYSSSYIMWCQSVGCLAASYLTKLADRQWATHPTAGDRFYCIYHIYMEYALIKI